MPKETGHVRPRRNRRGEITSYEARIADPYRTTAGGNPLIHTQSFDSERDAHRWLARKNDELNTKGSITPEWLKYKLGEAFDDWLEKVSAIGDDGRGSLRASTMNVYRDHGERFIHRKPLDTDKMVRRARRDQLLAKLKANVLDIEAIPIARLTAHQLEQWCVQMVKHVGKDVTRRVLRDLKAALAFGAKKLDIPNRWTDVKLKKDRSDDGSVEVIIRTEEARPFMQGALQLRDFGFVYEVRTTDGQPEPDQRPNSRVDVSTAGKRRIAWARWAPLVWLLFRGGFRLGEALAFQWKHVDWKNGRILVEQTVSDQGRAIEKTKTKNSTRWVELDAETMAVLEQYYAWCKGARSKSDARPRFRTDRDAYVFGRRSGATWDNAQNFRNRGWYVLCELLGLLHPDGSAWASPHDARHWHASFLFKSGVKLADVSLRLGHSDTVITARTYIHELEDRSEADRETANRFASALGEIARAQASAADIDKLAALLGRLDGATLALVLARIDAHSDAAAPAD